MNQTVFRTIYTVSVNAFVMPVDPKLYLQVLQVMGVLLEITSVPGSTPRVLSTWLNESPPDP